MLLSLVSANLQDKPAKLTDNESKEYAKAVIDRSIRYLCDAYLFHGMSPDQKSYYKNKRLVDMTQVEIELLINKAAYYLKEEITLYSPRDDNLRRGIKLLRDVNLSDLIKQQVSEYILYAKSEQPNKKEFEITDYKFDPETASVPVAIAYSVAFNLDKGLANNLSDKDSVAVAGYMYKNHSIIIPGFLSQDQVKDLCPKCADSMIKKSIPFISADFLEKIMTKKATEDLSKAPDKWVRYLEDNEPALIWDLQKAHPEVDCLETYKGIDIIYKQLFRMPEDTKWTFDLYKAQVEAIESVFDLDEVYGRDVMEKAIKELGKLQKITKTVNREGVSFQQIYYIDPNKGNRFHDLDRQAQVHYKHDLLGHLLEDLESLSAGLHVVNGVPVMKHATEDGKFLYSTLKVSGEKGIENVSDAARMAQTIHNISANPKAIAAYHKMMMSAHPEHGESEKKRIEQAEKELSGMQAKRGKPTIEDQAKRAKLKSIVYGHDYKIPEKKQVPEITGEKRKPGRPKKEPSTVLPEQHQKVLDHLKERGGKATFVNKEENKEDEHGYAHHKTLGRMAKDGLIEVTGKTAHDSGTGSIYDVKLADPSKIRETVKTKPEVSVPVTGREPATGIFIAGAKEEKKPKVETKPIVEKPADKKPDIKEEKKPDIEEAKKVKLPSKTKTKKSIYYFETEDKAKKYADTLGITNIKITDFELGFVVTFKDTEGYRIFVGPDVTKDTMSGYSSEEKLKHKQYAEYIEANKKLGIEETKKGERALTPEEQQQLKDMQEANKKPGIEEKKSDTGISIEIAKKPRKYTPKILTGLTETYGHKIYNAMRNNDVQELSKLRKQVQAIIKDSGLKSEGKGLEETNLPYKHLSELDQAADQFYFRTPTAYPTSTPEWTKKRDADMQLRAQTHALERVKITLFDIGRSIPKMTIGPKMQAQVDQSVKERATKEAQDKIEKEKADTEAKAKQTIEDKQKAESLGEIPAKSPANPQERIVFNAWLKKVNDANIPLTSDQHKEMLSNLKEALKESPDKAKNLLKLYDVINPRLLRTNEPKGIWFATRNEINDAYGKTLLMKPEPEKSAKIEETIQASAKPTKSEVKAEQPKVEKTKTEEVSVEKQLAREKRNAKQDEQIKVLDAVSKVGSNLSHIGRVESSQQHLNAVSSINRVEKDLGDGRVNPQQARERINGILHLYKIAPKSVGWESDVEVKEESKTEESKPKTTTLINYATGESTEHPISKEEGSWAVIEHGNKHHIIHKPNELHMATYETKDQAHQALDKLIKDHPEHKVFGEIPVANEEEHNKELETLGDIGKKLKSYESKLEGYKVR